MFDGVWLSFGACLNILEAFCVKVWVKIWGNDLLQAFCMSGGSGRSTLMALEVYASL